MTKKSDNPICYINYSIKSPQNMFEPVAAPHIFQVVTEPPLLAKNLYIYLEIKKKNYILK